LEKQPWEQSVALSRAWVAGTQEAAGTQEVVAPPEVQADLAAARDQLRFLSILIQKLQTLDVIFRR
jgi:hypothetical protein